MKKTLSTLAACGLLLLAGCARAEPQPMAVIHADPAIWVVKDDDTTIYLFGTVHVLRPEVVWFDDAVKAAFDRSDELMLEMVEPPPSQMAPLVARLAFNPNGPTVSERLSPKARARYFAATSKAGVPVGAIDRFDPWMAAISLSIAPLQRMGFRSDMGAEDVLTHAAKTRGMPISGFETAEQQLGYFDNLPMPLQIAFLNSTVDDMPELPRTFATLIRDWSRGNVRAIAREMNSSLEKTPELAGILLYERNARWADWINRRMDRPGTVFIAVGAGHLAGKGSVQDELARKGWKAERIDGQPLARADHR